MIRVIIENHGCHPFGNAKARAIAELPRRYPAAPRADLHTACPDLDEVPFTQAGQIRPVLDANAVQKNKDISKAVPADPDFRAAWWNMKAVATDAFQPMARVELQQENFTRSTRKTPECAASRTTSMWVKSPTGAQIAEVVMTEARGPWDHVYSCSTLRALARKGPAHNILGQRRS